jgi:hypothetical protein
VVKKFWVLMLVFCIFSIAPANAVQIESFNMSNIGTISDKNLENNDITSEKNITHILNYNNTTETNKTVINETKSNNTNGTDINGTDINGTDINGTAVLKNTISNDTNKTENIFNTKGAIIGTLSAIASISAVITPFLFQATVALAAIPDVTITKVLAVACGVATAVCACCTLGCAIAAIFCWWLL